MVAATTIVAANRSRCEAGLRPCLFRRNGFDQKKTFVVPDAVVLPSHPLDHSVSDVNRINRHIAFVPPGEPCPRVPHQSLLFFRRSGPARNALRIIKPNRSATKVTLQEWRCASKGVARRAPCSWREQSRFWLSFRGTKPLMITVFPELRPD